MKGYHHLWDCNPVKTLLKPHRLFGMDTWTIDHHDYGFWSLQGRDNFHTERSLHQVLSKLC